MYRVVRASVLYYEEYMRQSKARYNLIKPFMLLVSSQKFKEEKKALTKAYLNLCDIVSKMRSLYNTGKSQYHHFDMLLKELQVLGFNVDEMEAAHITNAEKLDEQISLLLQFLAFRYPFDEYDNKIGVHDLKTNTFIFVQP